MWVDVEIEEFYVDGVIVCEDGFYWLVYDGFVFGVIVCYLCYLWGVFDGGFE